MFSLLVNMAVSSDCAGWKARLPTHHGSTASCLLSDDDQIRTKVACLRGDDPKIQLFLNGLKYHGQVGRD